MDIKISSKLQKKMREHDGHLIFSKNGTFTIKNMNKEEIKNVISILEYVIENEKDKLTYNI